MTQKAQFCQFCSILNKKATNNLVIAQNQTLFAFHDIDNASAECHVLVCTKQHIQSVLNIQNPHILKDMQTFGEEILTKLYQQKNAKKPSKQQLRFGFHVPPFISIFHIHLHCFILPFKKIAYDKIVYGYGKMFKSVEEVTSQLLKLKAKL